MFEVGKKYRITMIVAVPGDWTDETGVWTVAEVEGTLLKLEGAGGEKIVNTASWHFVSAEPA